MAWTDATIGDPKAKPIRGARPTMPHPTDPNQWRDMTEEERVKVVARLKQVNTSDGVIAMRLGTSRQAVAKFRGRHGIAHIGGAVA